MQYVDLLLILIIIVVWFEYGNVKVYKKSRKGTNSLLQQNKKLSRKSFLSKFLKTILNNHLKH